MDLDKGLVCLGRWSKWQLMWYLVTAALVGCFASWHMLAIVFLGQKPASHHCAVPDGVTVSNAIPPSKDDPSVLASCSHYAEFSSSNNITEGCPDGWTYSDDVYSMIHQWDAVCDNAHLTSTSQTVLIVGVMIGAILMSSLADKFGRKTVLLASVIGISFFGFVNAWATNYILFCICRFFIGIFQQGVILCGFVYACELFPSADRTIAGLMMQVAWGFGLGLLTVMAYLTANWQHFLLCMSLPGLIAIPFIWLMDESMPYLVAQGRFREAKQILAKAAKFNKVTLPKEFALTEEELDILNNNDKKTGDEANGKTGGLSGLISKFKSPEKAEGETHQYGMIDVLRSKKLTMFSLLMAYLWCTSALVYYGLSLSTGSLAGNHYVNFLSSSFVEIPAYAIAAVCLQYIGRRWPIFVFHLVAGVPLFINAFLPKTTLDCTSGKDSESCSAVEGCSWDGAACSGGTSLKPLIVALAMIGKFGITGCFGSVYLWAPEMFPTTIRSLGIGIASVGSRFGNIAAPYMGLVAEKIPWLPPILFGIMCIVAAVLTLILPETLGRPLPQTIEEVENWSRTLSAEEQARYKESVQAEKERRKLLLEGGDEEGGEELQTMKT